MSIAAPPARRPHLWRWAVALVATAMLIVSGSGLVVFAQSGTAESQGPAFVPADAGIYLEARLDLPAGQDEALAQMMTAFPGFADAGSFQLKLDEILAGLAAQMGMDAPDARLVGDVFTGEIGLALGDLGEAMMGGGDPPVLIGMAVANPDMVAPILDAMATDDVGAEVYGEATIVSDMSTAATLYGGWLLLSNDAEQVKAAVDVLDGTAPSLAQDPDFAAAFERVPDARLAAGYVDLASFGSVIDMAGMMASGQTGMELPMADLAAALPSEMVMSLVAEADRMHLNVDITAGEMPIAMATGESDLATRFPADTQVYVEMRDLGATVEGALTTLVDLMASQEGTQSPDGSMGDLGSMTADLELLFGEDSPFTDMLGAPLPQLLDFVEDAAMGAAISSDGLWLGIAAEISDADVADERVGNILSLIRFAALGDPACAEDPADCPVQLDTEMVGDTEVTTVTLPLEEMVAGTGLPISLGDSISVAVTDEHLLIGLGDFVQAALASDGSDSLATSEGYVDALGGATVNSGLMYANVSSLLAELDPMISAMVPEWADIAPYAAGLDRMIAVGTTDDDVMSVRMTVIVGS